MGRLFAAIVLVAIAFASAASAQTVVIYGVGNKSCEVFIASSHGLAPGIARAFEPGDGRTFQSDNSLFIQWALAFVTANNASESAQISPEVVGLDLWLRNWCTRNPTEMFAIAVVAFIRGAQQQ